DLRPLERQLASLHLLPAHGSARSTRRPNSVFGTRTSAPCSPWSVVFPLRPPPTAFRLCSGTSQVLHDRATLHQRSCWTCGSSPSPTGPLPPSGRALAEPPGSRAWSFHTCGGL